MKYQIRIHANPNLHNVKFIGEVSGNTIPEVKEKARKHALRQNERSKRLHLEDVNSGKEWIINTFV